jgi:hypothetical protein
MCCITRRGVVKEVKRLNDEATPVQTCLEGKREEEVEGGTKTFSSFEGS